MYTSVPFVAYIQFVEIFIGSSPSNWIDFLHFDGITHVTYDNAIIRVNTLRNDKRLNEQKIPNDQRKATIREAIGYSKVRSSTTVDCHSTYY
jgi:hypothetical protein